MKIVIFLCVLMMAMQIYCSCLKGYFSNEHGQCLKCPDHCTDCESIQKCSACKDGYWGTHCDRSCERCQPGTSCEKTNGVCEEKCIDGYTRVLCDALCDKGCVSCSRTNKNLCDQCLPRMYGVSCENECPKLCYLNACNKSGHCTLGCKNRYWGSMCERSCSRFCKSDTCDLQSGSCIHGCVDSFTGAKCEIKLEGPPNNDKENDGNDEQDGSNNTSSRGNEASRQGGEIWLVILIMAALIVIVSVVVCCAFLFTKLRRRRLTRQDEPYEPGALTTETLLESIDMPTSLCNQESSPSTITHDTAVYASHMTVVPPDLLNIRFVKGCSGTVAYITCKDPINDSKEDLEFWKMVWQQNCSIIVKLSRNVEESPRKTYWPKIDEPKTCGPFTVKLVGFTLSDIYKIRSFELETLTDKRIVKQAQFKNWPCDRFPRDIESLLEFRQKVVNFGRTEGPTLVHCSDGHSRSNVYVALDMLLDDLEEERSTDMDQLLDKMRKQALITTDEQCDFLRKTREAWKTFSF